MTKKLARLGHYLFLVLLTAGASAVMWWVSSKPDAGGLLAERAPISPAPVAAQPRTLVRAAEVEAIVRDVSIRHSGKIEAWEDYSLGFEIGGRIESLGVNAEGDPLDDGDRVEAGALLARLDDRILRARLAEAEANLEKASSDVARTRRVRRSSPAAITEAEYQNELTVEAQAKAALEIARKSLEDSVLRSPVSGVIAERRVEPGESINPNESVFEVVENDRLRLVVSVPEARVRELEVRRRKVAEARANGGAASDPESAVFRAHVQLEGADLFGKPWPAIDAEVYRISETADSTTGLFGVEIVIDNSEGLLRPGMVATAQIVTDRILAYAVPEPSIMFRQGKTYGFTVEAEEAALPVLFWEAGQTTVNRARRFELTRWIDQGETILVPADKMDLKRVVTSGQQRLRDGQLIRVVNEASQEATLVTRAPAETR